MLENKQSDEDSSDFAKSLHQRESAEAELSNQPAQVLDFHHCGQEIENVVVLSIN